MRNEQRGLVEGAGKGLTRSSGGGSCRRGRGGGEVLVGLDDSNKGVVILSKEIGDGGGGSGFVEGDEICLR